MFVKFVTKIKTMGRHTDSTYSAIRQIISEKGQGEIYTLSDFAQFSSEASRKVMSRLAEDGFLVRLGAGIYLYPKMSRFGIVYPSTAELVKAIARRDAARVIPTGYAAANMLGLSEQVPMNEVYITDGTARVLHVDGREIRLKRGAPRNFAFKSETLPLIVAALRTIGEEELTREQRRTIAEVLRKEGRPDLYRADLYLVPAWIKRIVLPMIEEIENELASA